MSYKIVMTQQGLKFNQDLQETLQQDPSHPYIQFGKEDKNQKLKHFRPIFLSKLKISDIPEIRPTCKYPGYLGPNTKSLSSLLVFAPNLQALPSKPNETPNHSKSKLNSSQGFRRPLYVDFDKLQNSKFGKENDTYSSQTPNCLLDPIHNNEKIFQIFSHQINNQIQSQNWQKQQSSLGSPQNKSVKTPENRIFQHFSKTQNVSPKNIRPVIEPSKISTRELSALRGIVNFITPQHEELQKEFETNNRFRKQMIKETYKKVSEQKQKLLKDEVEKRWSQFSQPVHIEARFLTELKQEDQVIQQMHESKNNAEERYKERLFKFHERRWKQNKWHSIDLPGESLRKKKIMEKLKKQQQPQLDNSQQILQSQQQQQLQQSQLQQLNSDQNIQIHQN